ncbi:N-acetyltransferase [bacterium]|nr:N-acetyltransferase [bacterium]
MTIQIEKMSAGDWERVREIYGEGIAAGNATLETSIPAWELWDASHMKECRLTAKEGREVIGWAALTPVSGRCVYAGVAEVSLYIGETFRGKGAGKLLLKELICSSEKHGIWTMQAGILKENAASIELHKKCGFKILGVHEKLGKLKGIWRDIVLMERRSSVVGID